MGILRKHPHEGRKASEIYGKKTVKQIAADQCKEQNKRGGRAR